MEYVFTNGTATQQQLWKRAISLLRNLPGDALPLVITVSFHPADEIGQTSFAETTTTVGDANSSTKVRNDAPGFADLDASLIAEAAARGIRYDAHQHFNETAVHELGHSLFAALPSAARLAILALFGISTDSPGALHPPGSDWHDRPVEAIAETFKEAFLPARHRVFPNRTNIQLPYNRYPEFRRIIRTALPEVENGGELEPGEAATPGLDLDIFAVGEPLGPPFPAGNWLTGSGGKHGIWSTAFSNTESGPLLHNSGIFSISLFEGWVKDGTVLNYSFNVLDDIYTPPYESEHPLSHYNDSAMQWNVFIKKTPGGFEELLHRAQWGLTLMPPEVSELFELERVGAYNLGGLARGGPVPPLVFSNSIAVNATNFTTTRVCRGHLYRFVTIEAEPVINFTEQFPETVEEHERLRDFYLYRWLPSLNFTQAACGPGTGEQGTLVVPPSGVVHPGGARAGRVRSPHRIIGRRG